MMIGHQDARRNQEACAKSCGFSRHVSQPHSANCAGNSHSAREIVNGNQIVSTENPFVRDLRPRRVTGFRKKPVMTVSALLDVCAFVPVAFPQFLGEIFRVQPSAFRAGNAGFNC
jgi:hypothetical protein